MRLTLASGWETIAVLLLATASQAVARQHTHSPSQRDSSEDAGPYYGPTRVFVVEKEEDAWQLASSHATENKELLFTTVAFTHRREHNPGAIHQVRHLWENLHRIGRVNNSIILTYDLQSCQVMMDNGIPCFVDRYLRQPKDLPGQYGSDVPHWYQKYAWALKFITWGYVVTFIETDQVYFKDPLPYYNNWNDLQGLSDWRLPAVPNAKDRMTQTCRVYHMQKTHTGDSHLEWGPFDPNQPGNSYHINPCMSTGFWFLQPTRPAEIFLESFIDLMLHWRDWQIDQVLWNEVIMAFLIGQGKQRALHLSLLDTEQFANFEVWQWRKDQGLRVDPVMLHCGAMMAHEKEPYMREHGFWWADHWEINRTQGHISELSKYFDLTVPE